MGLEECQVPSPGASKQGPSDSPMDTTRGQSAGACNKSADGFDQTLDDVILHARAMRAEPLPDWPDRLGEGRGLTINAQKRCETDRVQSVCLQ
jgi:hypothetical protein